MRPVTFGTNAFGELNATDRADSFAQAQAMSGKQHSRPVTLGRESIFKALAQCDVIREFLAAFHRSTGLAVKLIPPGSFSEDKSVEIGENSFCAAVRRHPLAVNLYHEFCDNLLGRMEGVTAPQQVRCFAQMMHLAVPVIVDNRHAATLLAGQVFLLEPRKHRFARVRKHLARHGIRKELPRLERLWLKTPAISRRRLEGCTELLVAAARMIGECASRWALATRGDEPLAGKRARDFITDILGHHITLRKVSDHVHLSPKHFSRLFKKTTGITFTEFLWRAQIERAKELLHDPRPSIKEVAFACGFRSRSHFNHVFHYLAGVSPSEYRADIRQRNADRAQIK